MSSIVNGTDVVDNDNDRELAEKVVSTNKTKAIFEDADTSDEEVW